MGQNGKSILADVSGAGRVFERGKKTMDVRKSVELAEVTCYNQSFLITIVPLGRVRSRGISRMARHRGPRL
jgi:hypothetical protein